MTSSPAYAELLGRLDKRSKAIRDLWEIATHIGVFPLDAMKIDADIHDKSATAIRTLMERVEGLEKDAKRWAIAEDSAEYVDCRDGQPIFELQICGADWRKKDFKKAIDQALRGGNDNG